MVPVMFELLAQAKPTIEIVNNIPRAGTNYLALVVPGLITGCSPSSEFPWVVISAPRAHSS